MHQWFNQGALVKESLSCRLLGAWSWESILRRLHCTLVLSSHASQAHTTSCWDAELDGHLAGSHTPVWDVNSYPCRA